MNGIVHPGTNQTDCQTTVNGTCESPAGHKIRMDGTIDAQDGTIKGYTPAKPSHRKERAFPS